MHQCWYKQHVILKPDTIAYVTRHTTMAGSKTPIYTALAANLAIAIIKLAAAAITGSSAMASEGIHSLVDTSNEVLLLLGLSKSKKPADNVRQFGYGKELYFWAFIVSLLFFVLGGGFSIYEGVSQIQHPKQIKDPLWNYIVLSIAFLFDGASFITAFKEFNRQRGDMPFWRAVKKSKDPSTFIVLFEDAADVTGLMIAFTGILLSRLLHYPFLDGIASIMIGVLLTMVAILLVGESRSLLMGESVGHKEINNVIALVESNNYVVKVTGHQSMYLAPEEVILLLKVNFDKDTNSIEMVSLIQNMRKKIQDKYPHYKHLFIEPV